MNRLAAPIMAIIAAMLLQGCGGAATSASAPANVTVGAGDSSLTVSWDMLPGVTYSLYKAAGNNVTPENCNALPQCNINLNAVSPTVITGLTNGTTYSVTINGRVSGGIGGPASSSLSAIPRLAGASWSAGQTTVTGTNNLRGVTFGGALFVAVGDGGKIFSSPDGTSWTAQTSNVSNNLNAVAYSNGIYMAVGAGGMVLSSSNAITWTQQTSATLANTNELFAVAGNGAGGFVATGASGTIITTANSGTNWTLVTPAVTGNKLNGIAFGNGKYVAVGTLGTLLTSTDGSAWLTGNSQTASTLNGVAYAASTTTDAGVTYTGASTFVVIGAGGTLVTSPDAVTWTLQATPIPSPNLNALTYGRQFVAVGDNGGIFTSTDGINWNTQASVTPASLFAVTHNVYDYSAVGAAGLNFFAM